MSLKSKHWYLLILSVMSPAVNVSGYDVRFRKQCYHKENDVQDDESYSVSPRHVEL